MAVQPDKKWWFLFQTSTEPSIGSWNFLPQPINSCMNHVWMWWRSFFIHSFQGFHRFPPRDFWCRMVTFHSPPKKPTQTEALNSVCWTFNSSPNGGKMVIYSARTYWNNHLKKTNNPKGFFIPGLKWMILNQLSPMSSSSHTLLRNRCFKGLPNAQNPQCWPCEKWGFKLTPILTHVWYDWRILEEYLDFPGSKWLVNRLSHLEHLGIPWG